MNSFCICVRVCFFDAIARDLDLGVRERGNERSRIIFQENLILGFVDFSCGLSPNNYQIASILYYICTPLFNN